MENKMKLYGISIVLCMITLLANGVELKTVSYQSVPQLVADGEIKKIEIYDSGMANVDAIFTKKDGATVAVKKPRGLDQDAVFQQYLKDNGIQYIVYDYEYAGVKPTKRSPFWKSTLFMILPIVFMFGIPVLLILAIIKQAKTISKQTDTIKALVEKEILQSAT